eukprot:5206730-Prymnesium_polylepis.4
MGRCGCVWTLSHYKIKARTVSCSKTYIFDTSCILHHTPRFLPPRVPLRRTQSSQLTRIVAPRVHSAMGLRIPLVWKQYQPLLTRHFIKFWVSVPRPQHGTAWQDVSRTLALLVSEAVSDALDRARRPNVVRCTCRWHVVLPQYLEPLPDQVLVEWWCLTLLHRFNLVGDARLDSCAPAARPHRVSPAAPSRAIRLEAAPPPPAGPSPCPARSASVNAHPQQFPREAAANARPCRCAYPYYSTSASHTPSSRSPRHASLSGSASTQAVAPPALACRWRRGAPWRSAPLTSPAARPPSPTRRTAPLRARIAPLP